MKKRIVTLFMIACIGVGSLVGCSGNKDSERQAYKQYGINCIESGKYEEAVDAFQSALDQSVGTVGDEELDICFYKAKAQYLSGDVDAALETYTAIIDYNDDADAYYLRGNIYYAQGDAEKGNADFKSAISEDSDNYQIYIGIYQTLAANGLQEDGQKYLEDALKIKAKTGNDYMQLGRIYELTGDNESAEKNYKKAIEEDEPEANYYLGQFYLNNGSAGEAQACFDEYLKVVGEDSYILCEMGQAQLSQGNYSTAITYFETALDLDNVPNRQIIMKNLIVAYEYSGDFQSASDMMADYLEEYPNDQDAQRENQFLETR